MKPKNFILGTANLGKAYGLSNPKNFDPNASLKIMRHALSRGIDTFDTATEYGVAENLIGKAIGSRENVKIITKIPTREFYNYAFVEECLNLSKNNLHQKRIYGLMFHDPDIHKKKNIHEISKKLLDTGEVAEIGFSAYTLDSVLAAKEKYSNWTIFQVPENILDRRLFGSKELIEMAQAKNRFFIRSIFLQGLLLMDTDKLPNKFHVAREILKELNLFAVQKSVKLIDLCLSYASSIPWSSGIVIAAASESQLDEILNFKNIEFKLNSIGTLPIQILDPRQWGEQN